MDCVKSKAKGNEVRLIVDKPFVQKQGKKKLKVSFLK